MRQTRDFRVRVHAFHRRPAAARCGQAAGDGDEVGQLGEGAAADDVGLFARQFFHAAGGDGHVVQPQFDGRLLQKGGFFRVRVAQGYGQVGAADGDGDAGHAAARADVDQRGRAVEVGQQGEAVEQVVADHFGAVAQGGEVEGGVPFFQQGEVFEQQCLPLGRDGQAHGGDAGLQLLLCVHRGFSVVRDNAR